MEAASIGSETLAAMDSYKVPLPSSLDPTSTVHSVTFCSNSTRPVTFKGLPKDTCGELLVVLLHNIFTNFRACASPETLFVRTDQTQKNHPLSENRLQKVTLIGASNLKYSCGHFSTSGNVFEDKCIPGWAPSPPQH